MNRATKDPLFPDAPQVSQDMSPLGAGDAPAPAQVERLRSPVSDVDPFSTALPPRLLAAKAKPHEGPRDTAFSANVMAISLLTSPMTSSLYTRNSNDVMPPVLADLTLNTTHGEATISEQPPPAGLPRAAIGDRTGLRYRGHRPVPGQTQSYGLARGQAGSSATRRVSAVTVLNSDIDDDERTHTRRRRPYRSQPHSLPFSNSATVLRDRRAMSSINDSDLTAPLEDRSEAWTELHQREKQTCGGRVRELLYPKSSDVGIEGAESLIDHKMMKHSRHVQHRNERARNGGIGGGGGDGNNGGGGGHRISLANEADEGLMHIELPVAAVLEFTALQRRTEELRSGFLWYLPFLVVITLFILFTAPQGAQMNLATAGLTRTVESNLDQVATIGEEILLESIRIDTEQYSNDSHENFVEGGSALYPWMYTHFNETINSWTPQPDPQEAVDAQVARVAGYHRSPTFVSFRSLRTKRDVMRWLKNVFLPRLWDCQSPTYERSWLEVVHGSDRLIGAARMTTRRRATTSDYANSSYVCKRSSLAGLDISCQAGSGTEKHQSAAPPLVPSAICNQTNPARPAETLFLYQSSLSGYVAQLPFSASCDNVDSALTLMETQKEGILWPPYSREYPQMTELWSEYAMDTSSVNSCSSFFFHRSVTEMEIEYVTYVGAQNAYHYTRISFSFAATGSVVVPTMRVFVAPVLSWDTHFAQLGISIVVIICIIVYAVHCVVQFTSDYYRDTQLRGRSLSLDKDSSLRGIAAAFQGFLRLWPIVCFVALALSVAAVVAFWASLGRDHNQMRITYAVRNDFPSEIATLCVQTTPVYRRLGVAALFFVFMYLLRFSGALLGPWTMMEAIQAGAARVFTVAAMWFFVTIGVAVCARVLFGSVLHEFSSFGRAYMTITLLFVDRCRYLFSQDSFHSDRHRPDPSRVVSASSTEFDSTLPSVRGSSLHTTDPAPQDTKRRLLEGTNSPELHVFVLFIVYIQFFFFLAVLIAILTEAFRQSTVALQISRMPWSLTLRHFRRALSLKYAKESLRRLLWARRPALLYDDIARYVSLTDVAMFNQNVQGTANAYLRSWATGRSRSTANVLHAHLDPGAHISYAGVLWRFPREFQAEFGAMHLRQWWLFCVDSVRFLHHSDASWLDERLAAHYDAQPSGLRGWLKACMPSLPTLEARVFAVDAALEDLPHKIVRYVELEMQETPPLRSAEAKW